MTPETGKSNPFAEVAYAQYIERWRERFTTAGILLQRVAVGILVISLVLLLFLAGGAMVDAVVKAAFNPDLGAERWIARLMLVLFVGGALWGGGEFFRYVGRRL